MVNQAGKHSILFWSSGMVVARQSVSSCEWSEQGMGSIKEGHFVGCSHDMLGQGTQCRSIDNGATARQESHLQACPEPVSTRLHPLFPTNLWFLGRDNYSLPFCLCMKSFAQPNFMVFSLQQGCETFLIVFLSFGRVAASA